MDLKKFCKKNNLGNVIGISKLIGGLMHKMFKVETDKGIYAIKVLNSEVMSRNDAYNNFVISETISNLAKDNGIIVSSALPINGNYLTNYNDKYYMVLGSQEKDGLGRIILYKSDDLLNWEYIGAPSKSKGLKTEGFMWECPDVFRLDGKDILLCSPQGIDKEEKKYLNLFQNGYFAGQFNDDNTEFNRGNFQELDFGHDFYAAQTTQAPDGRRILIAWMAMWESDMPEKEDGWAGALTLPRQLHIKNEKIYMKPVEELKSLRNEKLNSDSTELKDDLLLIDDSSHVEINLEHKFTSEQNAETSFYLTDKNGNSILNLKYNSNTNEFELYRKDTDDTRYANILSDDKVNLRIFIDTSSIEIFINDGEAVFTERYYLEENPQVWINASDSVSTNYEIYELNNQAIKF